MTVRQWAAAALMLCAMAAASPAAAQVFGKNKVQYEPLDWSVLETRHLRLHFHTEEESLARHLVVFAESVCVEFDERFRVAVICLAAFADQPGATVEVPAEDEDGRARLDERFAYRAEIPASIDQHSGAAGAGGTPDISRPAMDESVDYS